MIKVKHTGPKCNHQQEAMIAQATDRLKRFYELLFTHGNICFRYHSQAHKFEPIERIVLNTWRVVNRASGKPWKKPVLRRGKTFCTSPAT